MEITLPVSGDRLTLKSWSMAKADEFYEAELAMMDMDVTARVAALRELRSKKLFALGQLYGCRDMSDMPSRDVLLLLELTDKYSANVPLSEIKNLLAGGDGTATGSAASTAMTAGA